VDALRPHALERLRRAQPLGQVGGAVDALDPRAGLGTVLPEDLGGLDLDLAPLLRADRVAGLLACIDRLLALEHERVGAAAARAELQLPRLRARARTPRVAVVGG